MIYQKLIERAGFSSFYFSMSTPGKEKEAESGGAEAPSLLEGLRELALRPAVKKEVPPVVPEPQE